MKKTLIASLFSACIPLAWGTPAHAKGGGFDLDCAPATVLVGADSGQDVLGASVSRHSHQGQDVWRIEYRMRDGTTHERSDQYEMFIADAGFFPKGVRHWQGRRKDDASFVMAGAVSFVNDASGPYATYDATYTERLWKGNQLVMQSTAVCHWLEAQPSTIPAGPEGVPDTQWYVAHQGSEICIPLDDISDLGERLHSHSGNMHTPQQMKEMFTRLGAQAEEVTLPFGLNSVGMVGIRVVWPTQLNSSPTFIGLFDNEAVCRRTMAAPRP
jgi:hypothetical protein